MRFIRLASILALAAGSYAVAKADAIFVFHDLSNSPFLTFDGTIVTGNGGRISSFSSTNGGEDISFKLFGPPQIGVSLSKPEFTDLLDTALGPTSDRWVAQAITQTTYTVEFGSVPGGKLPAVPTGAVTSGPMVETGLPELVGHIQVGPSDFDDFYIESAPPAPSGTPEPASLMLGGTVLAIVAFVFRRRLVSNS